MADYNFNVTLRRNAQSVIKIDSAALYGYWERADGSEGGGLWFQRTQLPGGQFGSLELVDYDGCFELPEQVVQLLREHGCLIDDLTAGE